MAVGSANLAFVFIAKDMASPQIAKINQSFVGMQKSSKKTTETVHGGFFDAAQIISGVGTSIKNSVGKAIDVYANFDYALTQAGTIANASTEELQAFKAAAIDAGIATDWSPTQAAEALGNLSGMGLSAKEALDALSPSLQLASASLGQLNPEEAVTAMMSVTNAYGVKASGEMLNNLAGMSIQMSNISSVAPEELPKLLAQTATSASQANQSMSDMFTIIAASHDVAGKTFTGSAVNQFIAKMMNPKKQADIQKAFGVEAVDKATGKIRSGLDVAAEIISKADLMKGGLAGAEASGKIQKIFGLQGARAIAGLRATMAKGVKTATGEILFGVEALHELRKQLENSGDAAKIFQDKMLNTVKGQRKLLAGSVETLMILVGEQFAKATKPIVGFIVNTINKAITAVQQLSEPTKAFLGKLVVYAAGAASAFGALISAVAGLKGLQMVLRGVGMEAGTLRRVLLSMTGWGLVLAAAGALVGKLWTENLGGFRDALLSAWNTVSTFFAALKQLLTSGELSGDVLHKVWGKPRLLNAIHTVWRLIYRVKRVVEGVGEGFRTAIAAGQPVFEKFVTALGRLWNAFGKILGGSEAVGESFSLIPSQMFFDWGVKVGALLGDLVIALVDVASWLVDKLAVGFEYVGKTIEFITPYIIDFWNMLTSPETAATASGLFATISDTIAGVVDWLIEAFEAGSTWVMGIYEWATASGGVVDQITQYMSALWQYLTRVFEGIAHLVGGVWEGIKAGLSSMGPYWDTAYGYVMMFYGQVKSLAGQVISFAQAIWNFVIPAVTKILNGFVALYDFVAPVLLPILEAIGYIFGWLATNIIQGILLVAIDGIAVAFSGVIAAVRLVVGVFRVAFTVVSVLVMGILDALGGVWKFLTGTLPNAFRSTFSFIYNVFQGIMDWFGRQIDKLVVMAGDMIASLPSWLQPEGTEEFLKQSDEAFYRLQDYEDSQKLLDKGVSKEMAKATYEKAQAEGLSVEDAYKALAAGDVSIAKNDLFAGMPQMTMPAVASEEEKKNRMEEQNAKLDEMIANMNNPKPTTVKTQLVVDGKVLAETIDKTKEEAETRSYGGLGGSMMIPE